MPVTVVCTKINLGWKGLTSRYTDWAIAAHEHQNKSSHNSFCIKFNLIKSYSIILANNIEFYKGWIRRLSQFQYLNCQTLFPIIRHVTLFWNADSSHHRGTFAIGHWGFTLQKNGRLITRDADTWRGYRVRDVKGVLGFGTWPANVPGSHPLEPRPFMPWHTALRTSKLCGGPETFDSASSIMTSHSSFETLTTEVHLQKHKARTTFTYRVPELKQKSVQFYLLI